MSTTTPNTAPANIASQAARLYLARKARAELAVVNGTMARAKATQHLRPWLAIACLCGADLPELAEGLAERRVTNITYVPRGKRPVDVTDGEARWLLADEICPRSVWAPILASARDAAFSVPLAAEDQLNAAVALGQVARHLQHDRNGRHHIPPFSRMAGLLPAELGEEQAA